MSTERRYPAEMAQRVIMVPRWKTYIVRVSLRTRRGHEDSFRRLCSSWTYIPLVPFAFLFIALPLLDVLCEVRRDRLALVVLQRLRDALPVQVHKMLDRHLALLDFDKVVARPPLAPPAAAVALEAAVVARTDEAAHRVREPNPGAVLAREARNERSAVRIRALERGGVQVHLRVLVLEEAHELRRRVRALVSVPQPEDARELGEGPRVGAERGAERPRRVHEVVREREAVPRGNGLDLVRDVGVPRQDARAEVARRAAVVHG